MCAGRLVFDHIPKTAGNTIVAALAEAFAVPASLLSMPHYRLPFGEELLAGHLWYFPGEELRDDYLYASAVRHPVDRSLSQFFFHRLVAATPDAPADPQLDACRGRSLDDLLRHGTEGELQFLSNVQVRHFARRIVDRPEDLDDDDLFEAAVQSAAEYDVIGTTEDLSSFVAACCDLAERPRPGALPRLNVGEREEVSSFARANLAHLNGADIRLWEWARQPRPPGRSRRGSSRPSGTADFGTREIEVTDVHVHDRRNRLGRRSGGIAVEVSLLARRTIDDLAIGVELRSDDLDFGANTRLLGRRISIDRPGRYRATFEWPGPVGAGRYTITAALHRGWDHHDGCYHWREPAGHHVVKGRTGSGPTPSDVTFALSAS